MKDIFGRVHRMEVLKLMMRNSDLLNAHTYSNDRLPAIHLDHLPKILLCKLRVGSDKKFKMIFL